MFNRKEYYKNYYKKHKFYLNQQNKEWRLLHPDHNFKWKLKYKYGITIEDYNRLLKKQNGKCAVCKQPERIKVRNKLQRLCVDHNHKTGKIRGLVCASCNKNIGIIENKKLIQKIFNYLRAKI